MIPIEKIYSADTSRYDQKSVSARLEALFLNNVGLVVTREQIIAAARNPLTGKDRRTGTNACRNFAPTRATRSSRHATGRR